MNYWSLCNIIIAVILLGWLFIVIKKAEKWKNRYTVSQENLSNALVLQLKEGGEREMVANEIIQSLSIIKKPSRWFRCRICKRWRPFEKTGVNIQKICDNEGKEIGSSNVVFCNDNPECIKEAPKYNESRRHNYEK